MTKKAVEDTKISNATAKSIQFDNDIKKMEVDFLKSNPAMLKTKQVLEALGLRGGSILKGGDYMKRARLSRRGSRKNFSGEEGYIKRTSASSPLRADSECSKKKASTSGTDAQQQAGHWSKGWPVPCTCTTVTIERKKVN